MSVVFENAVVPPTLAALDRSCAATPPCTPVVRSQARNVSPSETVPLKPIFGWKYTRVAESAARRRAVVLVGLPSVFHVKPLSSEYHQVPFAVFAPVTAMPPSAPGSGSLCPVRSAETRDPTGPEGAGEFATSVGIVTLTAASSSGASLALVTAIVAAFACVENAPVPPVAPGAVVSATLRGPVVATPVTVPSQARNVRLPPPAATPSARNRTLSAD